MMDTVDDGAHASFAKDRRRYAALALANLCLNKKSHGYLEGVDLESVLHRVIDEDDIHISSSEESKSYACVAASALVYEESPFVNRLLELGTIPATKKLLQTVDPADTDQQQSAAFLFNKLSMLSLTHQDFSEQQVATLLTSHGEGTNEHALTYSIAALRRLCDDTNVRAELVATDALAFLAKHCELQNIERCREIASGVCHLALWDEARAHIVESEMFDHILALAESPDTETARFALGGLANIADDQRYYEAVAERSGVVRSLLTLMHSRELSITRESSRAISNVLSSPSAQATFLDEQGLTCLVETSKLEDYECAYNASVAFRKLSASSFAHEALFAQGGIGAIVNLTTREEREIQTQSAAALRDIASNPAFKLVFAEGGGTRAAIEIASLPDVRLKTLAFGIIRHLSIPMQLKRSLVDSGIVNIMADCVAEEDDEDLVYQCVSSIANLAEHAQNKLTLIQMGVIKCLVYLCKHPSPHVKMETARAFALLSSAPENNIGVFDRNVLPPLLDLLRCQEEETGRDSAAATSNIATTPETISLIGSLGGIPPLILLLSSPFESCQLNSCKALCRLTTHEENKASVFSHGGLAPLINLCTSPSQEIALAAVEVASNLSTCAGHQVKFVHEVLGLTSIVSLLTSNCPLTRKNATKVLCNLTSDDVAQDHVARQVNLLQLFELMSEVDADCRAFATMVLCNLAAKEVHGCAILDAGGLQPLVAMLNASEGTNIQRAALLTLYNLSTHDASHQLFVTSNVVQSVITSCRSPDILCRRFSLMILANVSCNDKTRADATRGGGLQAAVLSLKDEDFSSRRFACICLANMGNDAATQSQVIVHGGLPALVTLCLVDDDETQDCAFMCLSNLAAAESNHGPLMKQGAFKAFVNYSSLHASQHESTSSTFAIANLTSSEILPQVGRGGGIRPLVALARSENLHSRCLVLSSLRRLAFVRENRDRLVAEGIIDTLTDACKIAEPEIQRETASCFCNLSLSINHRVAIARLAMAELVALAQSDDFETARLSLGALGNLAEGIDTHPFMTSEVTGTVVRCLEREELDIKREAARTISNLLSSCELHSRIISRGLDSLIKLSAYSCEECRYLTALAFRKLSPTVASHQALITDDALRNILALVKCPDMKTRSHATTALRDLSASGKDVNLFFKLGVPGAMVELLRETDREVQIVAMSTLRHLSHSERMTDDFSGSGIMQSAVRTIAWANEDMRCQIAGLFANLSEHRECQAAMVANGIIQAIDALLSFEHDEVWQDCSRTLANVCANEGKQAIIHRQGCLKTLAKLSKTKGEVCQRYVAIALRFMSSSVEVQKSLSKGSQDLVAYFPFIEFAGSNLLDFQRAAAAAFASMSLNDTGKSLVLRKGGIKHVLQLCIHLDLTVRRDAVFCVANFAASQDFCQYTVREGGVETIKAVASSNTDIEVLRDASRALSSFSTDVATKDIMISQEVPKVVCKLAKSPDNSTQRFAALALCNLCAGTREQKELVVKQGVLRVLLFLLRYPDIEIERCASLAIAALTLGSDRNKAEVVDSGFVRPLIETTTYPDDRLRQSALLALNGIVLNEQPESKECIFKEGGLPPLLELVKSDDDESIQSGIFLLGTLAENEEVRDALVAMECLPIVIDKSSIGSIEIKRASGYFLSLLSECPDYHAGIKQVGGLDTVVSLASLVDSECQDYGAFNLAFLANNKSFQVPLVQLGAVRPLVHMMATDSESKHYAALALLKLADNFENHVAIAEEGGINALLKLGKGKVASEGIKYKSALTVSQLAKNAASNEMSGKTCHER